MIQEVLPVIANELNNFFKLKFGTTENKVVLSSIVGQDGSVAVKSENKVIISIVNITTDGTRGGTGGASRISNIPTNVSIYVLFAAYFNSENYLEALKFTSGVVGFFQGKRVFTPSNSPGIPGSQDRIIMELVKLSFDELSNLWGVIGAKYMPSVVYRIRSLSISENRIRNVIPKLTGFD